MQPHLKEASIPVLNDCGSELPEPEDVLSQGFDFRPEWWQSRIPEPSWTAFLSDLPDARRGHRYKHITRRDLLTAPRENDDDLARLLVACYAWGTGTSAFLVGRRARVFTRNEVDLLRRNLNDALRLLSMDGPVAAYAALTRSGQHNLAFLGPSFYTKLLYAADARPTAVPGRALILDRFVATALNDLEGWNLSRTGPWSASEYERWLDYAHTHAGLGAENGRTVRRDAIEMVLFEYGRDLQRKRRMP